MNTPGTNDVFWNLQNPTRKCTESTRWRGNKAPVFLMVAGAAGFEPATYGFGDRRSTS